MHVEPQYLRVLAQLLSLPGGDALDALKGLCGEYPWLVEAVAELESLPLDQWQGECTRLFINGYPKTACPPFESAYRHGQMGGRAMEELLALYHQAGLMAEEVPADYLGAELECAAYLLETGESGGQVWDKLWREHLLKWVPGLANDLMEQSELTLYRRLGEQLQALCVEQERGENG